MDFITIYQYIIYMIVHYFSFWMILTSLIAAVISQRISVKLDDQYADSIEVSFAKKVTVLWGTLALFFWLVVIFFT